MKTFGSLFTGGGGADVGAHAAGLTPLWGVEYDPDIAAVARQNLPHAITVADVLDCDPADFEPVDVLHASPPCPNFSQAKANAEETELDIALARKVAEFVEVLCPAAVTIENVYGYRKSKAFRHILKALRRNGYKVRWWHLNAADYGVPQSRKRLILVAAQGFVPQRPPATHAPADEIAPMFDDRKPWVGWYEAIEDLIPELPDSQFANWQLERLPSELRTFIASSNSIEGRAPAKRDVAQPAVTVDTKTNGHLRAFIVGGANTSKVQAAPGVGVSDDDEPTRLVNANNSHDWRAFVLDGKLNSNGASLTRRNGSEPQFTVTTSHNNRDVKAYSGGRVVQMTPRALARFQGFPDEYILPESKTLACRIIGNAIPCLLYQRIVESFT